MDEKKDSEEQAPDTRAVGISRRAIAAAAVGAMIVPRHVLGGNGFQAPSDTLRIGGVGVGGMGRRYIQGCASERIEVLCDREQGFFERAAVDADGRDVAGR